MSLFARMFSRSGGAVFLDEDLSDFNRLLCDLCTQGGDENTQILLQEEIARLSPRYGYNTLFAEQVFETLLNAHFLSPGAANFALKAFLAQDKHLKLSFGDRLAFFHARSKDLEESFKIRLNTSHALPIPKI